MVNSCMRCGYSWSPRSESPIRCPKCKSTRWNHPKIMQTCCRCGFSWTQRGDVAPRYCPSCHSSMWNIEKTTFTCPKCGKTRVLRSNSRTDMCPFCDEYTNPYETDTGRPRVKEIGHPITVWAKDGMALIYSSNGSGEATLYKDGTLVNKTNFDLWLHTHNYSPKRIYATYSEPSVQKEIEILVNRMYSERKSYVGKAEIVRELRAVSKPASEIIALSESGMIPIAISMKLKIPFTQVMDVLNNIPPIKTPEKLEPAQDTVPGGEGETGRTDSQNAHT